MRVVILASALALSPCVAMALQEPAPGKADPRMQTARVEPNNITALHLKVGRTVAINLPVGETVTDYWGSDVAHLKVDFSRANTAFVKAIMKMDPSSFYLQSRTADGNIRIYAFQVDVTPIDGNDAEVYSLTFTDLARDAAARAAAYRAWKEKQDEKATLAALDRARHENRNNHYAMRGKTANDWDLLPTREIYDDGYSTYFHFPGNMQIPMIYAVNHPKDLKSCEGDESLADYTYDSATRIAAVHQIAPAWHLRLGYDAVLCIRNDHYDPVGVPNPTGTASPDVVRIIKDNTQ